MIDKENGAQDQELIKKLERQVEILNTRIEKTDKRLWLVLVGTAFLILFFVLSEVF
jgi:hypothetical protein